MKQADVVKQDDEYTSDRFMTAEMMIAVSRDLEAGGFTHVTACHLIDPEWREQYRPGRPELEPVAWTVQLHEQTMPMSQARALFEVCDRHGLVFWMGSAEGELYVKIARPGTGAQDWL